MRKESSLSDPPVGTSIAGIMELLTAKPSPCCLGSSADRHFQKNVKSVSLTDPLSARRVSWRQAISILSRKISLLMIAVFRESSLCWRSVNNPGHMVLTFQLAMRRAGLRVVFTFLLLGASMSPTCQVSPKLFAP